MHHTYSVEIIDDDTVVPSVESESKIRNHSFPEASLKDCQAHVTFNSTHPYTSTEAC
jgi:hypothetical protein